MLISSQKGTGISIGDIVRVIMKHHAGLYLTNAPAAAVCTGITVNASAGMETCHA